MYAHTRVRGCFLFFFFTHVTFNVHSVTHAWLTGESLTQALRRAQAH